MLRPHLPTDIPSYKFVQNDILATIQQNKLRTGDSIPSEKVLAEQYQVSVGTIKKALGDLVAQGYLYRQQGRGTFVAGGFMRPSSMRLYTAVPFFDKEDQEQASRFISSTRGKADALFSRATGLPERTPVFILQRILFSAGKRFVYIISYLKAEKLPGFDNLPGADFERSALHVILDKEYGVHSVRCKELLSAAVAEGNTAKYLDVPAGTPLLRSDMVLKTYNDEPYEYRISYCRTDILKLCREF
ncbi:MAG: GntR family transcriptional regulator [Syntrophobacteraceae bacterium]|nr:GntR family transcriptional regulator [Desulfobacteraceae bacterium]